MGEHIDKNLMRIGEIAGFFNISVKAIRLYEQKGIIKPDHIDKETGYRYYAANQIHKLNALIELKQLGFSLSEIKKLLEGGMTGEAFEKALLYKKTTWQDAISLAEYKIQAIQSIMQRINETEPTQKIHELTEEERAWLLVKMVCVEDLKGQSVISEAIWL